MPRQGVNVVAISSNDVVNYPQDDVPLMKVGRNRLHLPYLYDPTQDVARAYDAACTPDFSVFDANRVCVYRGQFDGARPGNDIPVTAKTCVALWTFCSRANPSLRKAKSLPSVATSSGAEAVERGAPSPSLRRGSGACERQSNARDVLGRGVTDGDHGRSAPTGLVALRVGGAQHQGHVVVRQRHFPGFIVEMPRLGLGQVPFPAAHGAVGVGIQTGASDSLANALNTSSGLPLPVQACGCQKASLTRASPMVAMRKRDTSWWRRRGPRIWASQKQPIALRRVPGTASPEGRTSMQRGP